MYYSTGNKEVDRILYQFDRQCERYTADKFKRELFILTLNFTVKDWREVRKGDYWEKRDALQGVARDRFKLSRVREYLNTNKNHI
jgi:hypothetical protein